MLSLLPCRRRRPGPLYMRRSAPWTCKTPAARTCRTSSSCGGAHGRARSRERSRRVGRVLGHALEALAAQHHQPRSLPALPRARWSCYPAKRAAPTHRYSALARFQRAAPEWPPRAAVWIRTPPRRTAFWCWVTSGVPRRRVPRPRGRQGVIIAVPLIERRGYESRARNDNSGRADPQLRRSA